MQPTPVESDPTALAGPSSSAFTGHCLCGAVTITVAGEHDPRVGAEPEQYELMPGLFDEARGWPLRSEIYTDRALASVSLAGDHRRKSRAEYEADNPFVST